MFRTMGAVRLAATTLLVALLVGCGSDSGLRSPDYGTLQEFESGTEREAWIRTELLIGLPWRDAQEMAHDAGWSTKVIFAVEGEPVVMTKDLSLGRLRLVVVGGEGAGTVVNVYNS